MGLMIIFPAAEEADTEVRLLQLLEPVFTEYPSCTVIRTEQELEPLLVEGKLAGQKTSFCRSAWNGWYADKAFFHASDDSEEGCRPYKKERVAKRLSERDNRSSTDRCQYRAVYEIRRAGDCPDS